MSEEADCGRMRGGASRSWRRTSEQGGCRAHAIAAGDFAGKNAPERNRPCRPVRSEPLQAYNSGGRRRAIMSAGEPAQLMTTEEAPVCARLTALGIAFTRHEHPPAATVEEAEPHWAGIDAMHCKNLFLRNQKGSRHYLVIIRHSKRADLRAIADQIGDGKLSFGSPERLRTHLGVTPGSVSPFGLIHDHAHQVRVVIDRDLKSADRRVVSPEHQHRDAHDRPFGFRAVSGRLRESGAVRDGVGARLGTP